MRVVFLGSPEFAVPSLAALHADPEIDISLVVTQPDRRAGRSRRLVSPTIKLAAEERGLPVFQPETINSGNTIATLVEVGADLFVVVSYGELLRNRVLEIPAYGCLNVHPSLLPRYRGATPIPAAILCGDKETGVSIMRMVRRLDAGPVLAQKRVALDHSETAGALTTRLANVAAEILPSVAKAWVSGDIEANKQDDSEATYTRELRKSDAQIDWSRPQEEVERFIRAMDPWPRAWTMLRGQRISIHHASAGGVALSGDENGSLREADGRVYVSCADGTVEILAIQPAGKQVMGAGDWYRGVQDRSELRFELPESTPPPFVERR